MHNNQDNILPSPAASDRTPGQHSRLLPHVPKRYVVPRISAKDFYEKSVSFAEDENNAVTHLGGEELNRKLLKKPLHTLKRPEMKRLHISALD